MCGVPFPFLCSNGFLHMFYWHSFILFSKIVKEHCWGETCIVFSFPGIPLYTAIIDTVNHINRRLITSNDLHPAAHVKLWCSPQMTIKQWFVITLCFVSINCSMLHVYTILIRDKLIKAVWGVVEDSRCVEQMKFPVRVSVGQMRSPMQIMY